MHIFKISVIVGCLFACGMTYGAPAYPFSQKDNRLVIDAGASLPVVLESSLPTGRTPMASPLIFALSTGHVRGCQVLAMARFTPHAFADVAGLGDRWSIKLQKITCGHDSVPVHGVVESMPGSTILVPHVGDRLSALFTRRVSISTK